MQDVNAVLQPTDGLTEALGRLGSQAFKEVKESVVNEFGQYIELRPIRSKLL